MANKINILAGNNQVAAMLQSPTNVLVAQITDDVALLPIRDCLVNLTWKTVPAGAKGNVFINGQATMQVITDSSGYAWIRAIVGDTVGDYVLTATELGANTSVDFTLTAGVPPYAIVPFSKVKQYLNIADVERNQQTRDTFIQNLINVASRRIEKFVNGPVKPQVFLNQIYNGNSKRRMFVNHTPLISLANMQTSDVMWRMSPDQPWTIIVNNINYIFIDPENPCYIELWTQIFPEAKQNIKFNYIAGYPTDPGNTELVCLEMVAEAYKQSSWAGGRLGQTTQAFAAGAGHRIADTFVELKDKHEEMLWSIRKRRP